MIYEVKIKEIELCGCEVEGDMIIELNKGLFRVYYQLPDSFVKENLLNVMEWEQ